MFEGVTRRHRASSLFSPSTINGRTYAAARPVMLHVFVLRASLKYAGMLLWNYFPAAGSVALLACAVCVASLLCVFASQVVGIKPQSLVLPGMAVLTNQQGLCPGHRLIDEMDHPLSLDECAQACAATAGCSHFTVFFSNELASAQARPRLRLWYTTPFLVAYVA